MPNDNTTAIATPPKRRHFSMLRDFHLADFFTLGNAACGVGAVLFAMLYMSSEMPFHFYAAAALAPAAFAFDVFDGKIARARHQNSALGRELDSLADIVSFGVAPAALIYFVCCGVSRLARYNVTAESLSSDSGKVRYFEGTPIPTSVLLTALLALAAYQERIGDDMIGGVYLLGPWLLHPASLLFALSGSLMISKTLHIPKL
jgi:CDP-diacylglycerol---serine O-phosphatidyltransferase